MAHTAAGAYILQVTGFHHGSIAHAVLVLQLALDDVRKYFRVTMRMRPESLPGLDHVVIDYSQRLKSHVIGIEILPERKRMMAVQPSQFRPSPRFSRSFFDFRFRFRFYVHSFHASRVTPE